LVAPDPASRRALFIALLIWWERRRPRQAPEAGTARRNAANRYSICRIRAVEAAAMPRNERAPGERTDTRDRELHRAPPVIAWSDDADPVGSDHAAAVPAGHGLQPELIVDWPAEDARRIVTLRILPSRQDRWRAGLCVRAGCLRVSTWPVRHLSLARDDGRVFISAASLVRPACSTRPPWTFSAFAGINVFAVLPGPVSADEALQRLAQVAVEVAARVGGRVQDENSSPFSAGEALQWRQRCLSAIQGAQAAVRRAD